MHTIPQNLYLLWYAFVSYNYTFPSRRSLRIINSNFRIKHNRCALSVVDFFVRLITISWIIISFLPITRIYFAIRADPLCLIVPLFPRAQTHPFPDRSVKSLRTDTSRSRRVVSGAERDREIKSNATSVPVTIDESHLRGRCTGTLCIRLSLYHVTRAYLILYQFNKSSMSSRAQQTLSYNFLQLMIQKNKRIFIFQFNVIIHEISMDFLR